MKHEVIQTDQTVPSETYSFGQGLGDCASRTGAFALRVEPFGLAPAGFNPTIAGGC